MVPVPLKNPQCNASGPDAGSLGSLESLGAVAALRFRAAQLSALGAPGTHRALAGGTGGISWKLMVDVMAVFWENDEDYNGVFMGAWVCN